MIWYNFFISLKQVKYKFFIFFLAKPDSSAILDENGRITKEQVPNSMRNYKPLEYDRLVYEGVLKTGSVPYLGTYGKIPEISFRVEDKEKSMKMAKKYNQHTIYDAEMGKDYDWEHGDQKDYDDPKNPYTLNPMYRKRNNPVNE